MVQGAIYRYLYQPFRSSNGVSAHWFGQDSTPVYFLNTVLFIVFTLYLPSLDHVYIYFLLL